MISGVEREVCFYSSARLIVLVIRLASSLSMGIRLRRNKQPCEGYVGSVRANPQIVIPCLFFGECQVQNDS